MMKLTIAFIVIGLLVFTGFATFHIEGWVRGYALWDKGTHLLLAWLVLDFSKKRYEKLFKPVFYLLAVRFCWEIISWLSGININNNIVVGILFIICILYVLYQAIKNVRS
jgi:hypothetical protein